MKLHRYKHEVYTTPDGPRLLDPVRVKLVPAEPEERVRQDVIRSLIEHYGFPMEALRSEEPIARGTKDRRRADVLVVLPKAPDGIAIEQGEFASTADPLYSKQVAHLEELLADDHRGAVRLLHVHDHLVLTLDGTNVECRVLGFTTEAYGHVLALLAPNELIERGYPEVLCIQVNGYGQAPEEMAFASHLGIPICEFRFDASSEFVAGMSSSEPDERSWFEENSLSADGRTGYAVLVGAGAMQFGVLAEVDLDRVSEGSVATLAETDQPGSAAVGRAPVRDDGSAREQVGGLYTVAVIECKAPSVTITEEVLRQGLGYAAGRGAKLLTLTNGVETSTFALGDEVSPIADLPTYTQITADPTLRVVRLPPRENDPPLPVTADGQPDLVRMHRRFRATTIGAATPPDLWLPLLSLDEVLASQAPLFNTSFDAYGIRFVEDLGPHIHDPGSVSGASWPGVYRDLIIELSGRKKVMLGLSLRGTWKDVDRGRTSGVRYVSGDTYILCGLASGVEYEIALQHRVAKYAEIAGESLIITHDGSMTVGAGALRRQVVVDYVEQREHRLLLCQRGVRQSSSRYLCSEGGDWT